MKLSTEQRTHKSAKPPWIQRHHHYELLASRTNSDGRNSSRELCSAPQCSDQARTASHFSRASSERQYTRPRSFEYFGRRIKKSSSLTSLPVGLFDVSERPTSLLLGREDLGYWSDAFWPNLRDLCDLLSTRIVESDSPDDTEIVLATSLAKFIRNFVAEVPANQERAL